MRRIALCFLLILGLSGALAFGIVHYFGPRGAPAIAANESDILSCFVPDEDCTKFVVEAIALGKSELLVQAYNYTSPPILEAVAQAKTKNRLDVRVILDKSNEQPRYTGGTYMVNHGVPVLIDHAVAIAHNKVMIIDRRHVLTGSFNFTISAQKRNAENLVLIRNVPELARRYAENWERRAKVSRPFKQNPPP